MTLSAGKRQLKLLVKNQKCGTTQMKHLIDTV